LHPVIEVKGHDCFAWLRDSTLATFVQRWSWFGSEAGTGHLVSNGKSRIVVFTLALV